MGKAHCSQNKWLLGLKSPRRSIDDLLKVSGIYWIRTTLCVETWEMLVLLDFMYFMSGIAKDTAKKVLY